MEYRPIQTAPEDQTLEVIWGQGSPRAQRGEALRSGEQWYIYGQSNPHANGRPCAVPNGWLPKDRKEWTGAEIVLCDILGLFPDTEKYLEERHQRETKTRVSS